MPLVEGADLRGPYYYDRSTHSLRSRESKHRASTGSSVVKGAATSISRDPLKGTKYEWNTQHRRATVLSIRDTTAGRVKEGKPVGAPVFRIDKPHRNAEFPHINVEPNKFGLNHKPIPQTAFKAASHADEIARGLKGASRALGATGAAMDAYDIYQGYKADGNKIGNHTKQAVGRAVGGWAGALAGAEVGGMAGASLGSMIVPGAGTAIGGFVGAMGGAVGGAIGGSKLGEWLMKR
ncbi:hypothetical protein [Calditerricola satsumensis]|uniref:hypothetical protein n=1 Tax=Calditerricola satsumensis TaxID=373054 RepID=UPI0006D225DC|nr:hypothetical protein [Calditerricola satsumensis]